MTNLPLANLKILEISTGEPAAFCAGQLGDLGAEVLRIELPGRTPDYPQQVWEMANRNKKSIFLNPQSPGDMKVFGSILQTCDVLLEDQLPGSLDALGMGYDKARAVNPALIYCSISCYGQDGPYRGLPGDEICAQAIGGMLLLRDNTLGNIGNQIQGRPQVPDVMVAETKAALHAVSGILAALMARRKTGHGQYVEVSLLDGVVSGKASRPMAELQEEGTGFQIYETKDHKYIVTAAVEPWTWRNLVEKLGRPDLAEIPYGNKREKVEAITILRNIFKNKTRQEWLDLFQDVDTELSPAYSYEEARHDPQIQAREMLLDVDCADGTKAVQYSIPMKFSEAQGQIRRAAPKIGQDTEQVFSQFR